MNSNIIPTFTKVELLVKTVINDVVMPSLSKVEFEDAGMMITGNYMIITTKEYNSELNEMVQTSKIFHLNEINSYRTHNKK
jgi:hypothetical protein